MGGSFEIGRRWVDEKGGGGLENWTIFMDVICVSSLKKLMISQQKSLKKLTGSQKINPHKKHENVDYTEFIIEPPKKKDKQVSLLNFFKEMMFDISVLFLLN